ncbi:TPA_asm: hypothetical protein GZO52_14230 [Listeria monocytogenes]|nr:hypothetical protein [Listeria monocytogenes]HAC3695911.1 hypothetical protein [Listeria monocytogenes]
MGVWVFDRWWKDFDAGERLCGGRTLQEGLHARFARMHIWAVIRFASNEPNGMEGFKWMVDGF